MPEAEALKPKQFKYQGIFNFEMIQALLYCVSHQRQQYFFYYFFPLGGIRAVLISKSFLQYWWKICYLDLESTADAQHAYCTTSIVLLCLTILCGGTCCNACGLMLGMGLRQCSLNTLGRCCMVPGCAGCSLARAGASLIAWAPLLPLPPTLGFLGAGALLGSNFCWKVKGVVFESLSNKRMLASLSEEAASLLSRACGGAGTSSPKGHLKNPSPSCSAGARAMRASELFVIAEFHKGIFMLSEYCLPDESNYQSCHGDVTRQWTERS